MEKIVVALEGNVEVELENYQGLFSLLYACGSDKIATTLEAVIKKSKLQKDAESKLTEDEAGILEALRQSFKELKDTPILILEKE